MSARLIQVIETDEPVGDGTAEKPYRRVKRYWTPEGDFIAERDPLAPATTSITNTAAKDIPQMKVCPKCEMEFDTRHLRDPETCPQCGGELHESQDDKCDHQWRNEGHGWRRCVNCGEILEP